MKIYAHRGASEFAPENTLPAFQLALDMQVDGIETDIQMTKDGVLVLIHDEKIDRTTNGSGYVCDYTYAELLQFDASYKFEAYKGCVIATLRELLELVQYRCFLHLELKTDKIQYQGIESKVLAMVKQYNMEEYVMYSSFNHETVQCMKKMDPSIKIAYTYDGVLYKPWRYIEDGIVALHPRFTKMCDIPSCHAVGLQVNAWTVNTKKDILQVMELGVDGVFTNNPLLVKQLRDG